MSHAVQTAEIVLGVLGPDVLVCKGLREYGVSSLASTSGDEAAVIGPVFEAGLAGEDQAAIDRERTDRGHRPSGDRCPGGSR